MSTLVYAPGVEVVIASHTGKIIDISDDIVQGQIQLAENNVHKGALIIANERRKYDGLFWPNDRIVVRMKRVRWLPIMSGYLNRVPMFSVYPRNIDLTFSCTLKRLENTLFDENSPEYSRFHNRMVGTDAALTGTDSGLGVLLAKFMEEVAGWEEDKVHVSDLPAEWAAGITEVYKRVSKNFAVTDIASAGNMTIPIQHPQAPGSQHPETGRGYGLLPTTTPRIGRLTSEEFDRWRADLSRPVGQYRTAVRGIAPWAVMGRFPFSTLGIANRTATSIQNMTPAEQREAIEWHKSRPIVLYNPTNNRAYCATPGCWGPLSTTNADLLVSDEIMDHLQVSEGDIVQMRWADDTTADSNGAGRRTNIDWGPVNTTVQNTSASPRFDTQTPAAPPGQLSATSPTINGPNLRWELIDLGRETGHASAGPSLPHVVAAWDFIKANWPGVRLTSSSRSMAMGYDNGTPGSHHLSGAALDISIPNYTSADARKVLASILLWFVSNPGVFGLEQAIYRYWGNSGTGWWSDSDHDDHVHLGFSRAARFAPTPQEPFAGANPTAPEWQRQWNQIAAEGFADGSISGVPNYGTIGNPQYQMVATKWNWGEGTPLSASLSGPRRLLNDAPVLDHVRKIANAGMRSFCSAPNGDFVAWYPDYFGKYGKLGALEVELIEVFDFTLSWNDTNFKTHIFVTGNVGNLALDPNSAPRNTFRQQTTHGIATVEFPEILQFVAGIEDHPLWNDVGAILDRFGARVSHRTVGTLSTREAEFFMAVYQFMANWASQYSTSIRLSFMPELFPGMLLRIPVWGVQFYVTSVSHNFSYGPEGFTTTVDVICPSTTGDDGKGRWKDLTNGETPLVSGGLDSASTPTREVPSA